MSFESLDAFETPAEWNTDDLRRLKKVKWRGRTGVRSEASCNELCDTCSSILCLSYTHTYTLSFLRLFSNIPRRLRGRKGSHFTINIASLASVLRGRWRIIRRSIRSGSGRFLGILMTGLGKGRLGC